MVTTRFDKSCDKDYNNASKIGLFKGVQMMKIRKLVMCVAALIVISPYLLRVVPETLLAIAGYAIDENGKLVRNSCECGEN